MDNDFFEEAEKIKNDLNNLIENNETKAVYLENDLKKVKYFVFIILLFISFSIAFVYTFKDFKNYINSFLIIFYSLGTGIYFWLLRERFRLLYGLIEILTGLSAIFIVFNKVDFNFAFRLWKFENFMGIIGGLYILVRGIDNLSKTKKGISIQDFLYLNDSPFKK